MNRIVSLTLTAAALVVAGVGAFWITQAFTGDEANDEPWVVPLSTATSSIDLDPDLPVADALAQATEELGLVVDGVMDDDWTDERPSDDEIRAAFGLPDDEPVPDDVTFPWGDAALAPRVDLTARGLTQPEARPADAEPVPTDADVWEDVDPSLPFAARELDIAGLPDDADDAEGELGDPAELDELLFRFWGTTWDGSRVVDDVPLLVFDQPGDPDFLDACAATVDDVPLDCGDGIGGTVMPLVPDLEIIAVAIDNGPRCEGLEAGDGLPVRITFNRPISRGTVGWEGTSGIAVRTRHELVADPDRIAAYHAAESHAAVYHHCLRLPSDPQSRRYTATIEAWAELVEGGVSSRAARVVEVSRPPSTEGRPPTSLEPLGDRRLLAHVPAHRDGTVRAHVIVRDPSERGLGSQCDPDQLDTADEGRWAGVGQPVRIRPAHRVRTPASQRWDPAYERTLVYDLSFRPTDLDEPMPTFELCLTWLQGSAGSRQVVARENHLIAPPQRPIVDVFIDGGGTSVRDTGVGAGSEFAFVGVHQLAEAPNGTSMRSSRRGVIVNDASDLCSRLIHGATLSEAAITPLHLCRFEMTDDRTEVLLDTLMGRRGPPENTEFNHARLVPLPGSSSHPSRPAGCSTRCADGHVALGWLSRDAYERNLRPDAYVNIRFVVTGDAHEPWLTLPLLSEEVRPDQPMLDLRATTLELWDEDPIRGIDLRYAADRPVLARFVARPASSGRAGTSPPGCPAPSVPHVVESDGYEQIAILSIRDACALTSYRFALELTDEDGNRAVYGDLLTWLVATRSGADLLAGDDAYVASGWQPRLRTRGHRLRLTADVQTFLTAVDEQLTPGVHVGTSAAGGRAVSLDDGRFDHPDDGTSFGDLLRTMEAYGEYTRLRQLDLHIGTSAASFGELAGDGLHCLTPVARYGPRRPTVEVGDVVPIAASGVLHRRGHSCGWNFRQINPNYRNSLYESIPLHLPAWSGSTTGSTTYLVDTATLLEAGRVRLVLSGPERCERWFGGVPEGCFDGTFHWFRVQALVSVSVALDNPPSRTLIGEF